MKTSLAEETLDALACAGKSPADVDVGAFSVEGVLRTCGFAAFFHVEDAHFFEDAHAHFFLNHAGGSAS